MLSLNASKTTRYVRAKSLEDISEDLPKIIFERKIEKAKIKNEKIGYNVVSEKSEST